MRKADRLFDIIQTLRSARGPMTAAALADALEVTPRTIYRDIAALQGSRVPIEGAAGVGYVLRRGYDLPPLMFSQEEIEAVIVGMRLVQRTGDTGLRRAADMVLSKVAAVVPDGMADAPFFVSPSGAPESAGVELGVVRGAMRDSRKLRITYLDLSGQETTRVICPVAVEFFVESTLVCAWCELRQDFRHFRADRITAADVLMDSFAAEAEHLLDGWRALLGQFIGRSSAPH